MDLAYDHIQDDAYAKKDNTDGSEAEKKEEQPQASLSNEVQDAYKAFSNSPWGAKLGGFFSNVAKQVIHSQRSPPHHLLTTIGRICIHPSLQGALRSSR